MKNHDQISHVYFTRILAENSPGESSMKRQSDVCADECTYTDLLLLAMLIDSQWTSIRVLLTI